MQSYKIREKDLNIVTLVCREYQALSLDISMVILPSITKNEQDKTKYLKIRCKVKNIYIYILTIAVFSSRVRQVFSPDITTNYYSIVNNEERIDILAALKIGRQTDERNALYFFELSS